MKLYSISIPTISRIDSQMVLHAILVDLLPYIILRKLRGHAIYQLFDVNGVMYDLI